jgi:peroxiredoxin
MSTSLSEQFEMEALKMCENASIEWFIEQIGKGPILLFTFSGDSNDKYGTRQLNVINSFFEEFSELGYRIYGLSSKTAANLGELRYNLLLKFPLMSCPDDSLVRYLADNHYIRINMTEDQNISWGKTLEASLLVLNQGKVVYTWVYSKNMSRSINLRPKIITILNTVKGGSYQQDHPTPVRGDESIFQCSIIRSYDQLLLNPFNSSDLKGPAVWPMDWLKACVPFPQVTPSN